MTASIGKHLLPHRPHLDHLRKQAKARLTEMRAALPEACLADAQHALAREYGFSTWSTLRAEVLRRAAGDQAPGVGIGHRRGPRPSRYRERAFHDSLLEQAAHAESQTAFFLSGAGTNVGVLFVIIAILTSLWVYSSALPGG